MIFNMNGGGGSNAGLNFKVVGGTNADTLPWNGDTTGLTAISDDYGTYYKVSDKINIFDNPYNYRYSVYDNTLNSKQEYPAWASSYGGYQAICAQSSALGIIIITSTTNDYDNAEIGIYFQHNGDSWISSLTVPNYDGFYIRADKENTIWVNTDKEITEWSFASKNPYTYEVDVDYLDGEATTAGYFSTTGTISTQSSTNKEVYVEKYIPVKYGKTYNYTYTLPESKSMWLAIVEYTGDKVFSSRTVLVNSVTGTSQAGEYTPAANVTSVRLSWRTFGLDASVEFVGAEERTDASHNGAVWIRSGISSIAEFNALKKNNITVCPIYARQYIDGDWVERTAKSYQNGAWVEWIPYGALCWHGNECSDLTGGWTSKAWMLQSDATGSASTTTHTITRNPDNLTFTKTGTYGAVMHTVKPIDLTYVKTIYFKGEMDGRTRANWCAFHVWTKLNGTYWATNSVASVTAGDNAIKYSFTLDVSSIVGEHYLGFGIYDASQYVKVEELYMEVEE